MSQAALEPRVAEEQEALVPARQLSFARAARIGAVGGLAAVFVSANGMVEAFATRPVVQPFLSLGYVLLLAIPVVVGYVAAQPPARLEGFAAARPGVRNVAGGALAGVLSGAALAAFVAFVAAVNVRGIFVNVSPALVERLTFGRGVGGGAVVLLAAGTALGAVSGAAHLVAPRWRRPILTALAWVFLVGLLEPLVEQVLRGARLGSVGPMLFAPIGGLKVPAALGLAAATYVSGAVIRERKGDVRARLGALPQSRRTALTVGAMTVIVVLLAVLPQVLGPFLSEVVNIAGIFLLMALGLNIVVGYAGLLDLGYVAFFAVGAYVTAVLTSPSSPRWAPQLIFWEALPFVVLAAAVAGILVGTPVLRMRGDYLAIVTLGFGEIARIAFLSDWLKPVVGGAQGIINIPGLTIGPVSIGGPQAFLYLIYGFVLFAAYVSWALQYSRIGRGWMAMREDEPVAEAMGVDIVRAKLAAFMVGAVLASFGGALFAAKIGSVFPHSFNIIVSITVLVVIIVGGMGSVPGVVLGALVLVGLPELLREFAEYKFLVYGALLIFMMLKRPEGFIPSKQRAAELHQEEVMQDAWLKKPAPESGEARGAAATP